MHKHILIIFLKLMYNSHKPHHCFVQVVAVVAQVVELVVAEAVALEPLELAAEEAGILPFS